jgi:broad specificity phosphatase PhoE
VDPPLNATGREQANALAVSLKSRNIHRLYASDLRRALQTALPLAVLWESTIKARSDLREISFGAWEGKRWSDVRADQPKVPAMESSFELSAPGGEPFGLFRDRTLHALSEIVADLGSSQAAAIVTHLGVIRLILSELRLAGTIWDPQQRIGYCAVYRIRIDGDCCELLDLQTKNQHIPSQRVGKNVIR